MTLDDLIELYFEARKKLQDELCARHEDDPARSDRVGQLRAGGCRADLPIVCGGSE